MKRLFNKIKKKILPNSKDKADKRKKDVDDALSQSLASNDPRAFLEAIQRHGAVNSMAAIAQAHIENTGRDPMQEYDDAKAALAKQIEGMSEGDFEAFVAEKALPAYHLKRVWPLGAAGEGLSHFGGQPHLPGDYVWPINKITNRSLHFLLQVDCSQINDFGVGSDLPKSGLLLFFADMDSEEEYGPKRTAVVHVPLRHVPKLPHPTPNDLPPLYHLEGKSENTSRNPYSQTALPEFPFTLSSVRYFERSIEGVVNKRFSDATHDATQHDMEALFAQLPERLEAVSPYERYEWTKIVEGREQTFSAYRRNPAFYSAGFPYCGAGLDLLLEFLEKDCVVALAEAEMKVGKLDDASWEWEITSAHKALDFTQQAIVDFEALRPKIPQFGALDPVKLSDVPELDAFLQSGEETDAFKFDRVINHTHLTLAQETYRNPALIKALPANFEALYIEMNPLREERAHMLLGEEQEFTNPTYGEGTRLLVLYSEMAIGTLFHDVGVIEFWIPPEDLARQDFSSAYGVAAGG